MSGLQAAILDWAGTVVDHGSRAPMGAFVRAFAEFGVDLTIAEARGPMGRAKRDHIATLMAIPHVAKAWTAKQGSAPDDAAIDALLGVFEPMNIAAVREHSDIIPGALEALAALTARGIRIAGTTGYTRPILEVMAPLAAAAGYAPEFTVCAGDLPAGRPSPMMMWHAMARLGVSPAWRVVKVDDTAPGIGEGVAAGTWTVGVSLSGNVTGLSATELAALSDADTVAFRLKGEAQLYAAGADLVIDSIAALPEACAILEARIARGERPRGG